MNKPIADALKEGIIRTTLKYNKMHDPKTGRFSSQSTGGSSAPRKIRESKRNISFNARMGPGSNISQLPKPPSEKSSGYATMTLSAFTKSNAYGGAVKRNELVMKALSDMSDGTVVGGWRKMSSGNETFWKKGSQTVSTLPDAVLTQSLHKSIVTRAIEKGTLSPQKAQSIHSSQYPGISNWPAIQSLLGLTGVSTKALLSDLVKKRIQVREYRKAKPFTGKNTHPIVRSKLLGLLSRVSPNIPVRFPDAQENRRDSRMKIKLSKLFTLPYKKSSSGSGGKISTTILLENPDKNNPAMYVPQNILGSNALSYDGWLNRDKYLTALQALNMKEKKTPASNKLDKGEYDEEGGMAKSQLQSIIRNAKAIYDGLEDDTNISEWAQSKITLAEDYISTVSNYMQGESEKTASKERNYRREYDDYHGTAEQKNNRNNRNKARRQLGLTKGDGMEAHHKVPLSKGGSNEIKNTQTLTFAENRKRGSKNYG